ncbi:MAG TPA: hypothetical protein VJ914_26690 [Pseudonocardiaceae bacterium]|nr:hypothetical protein [Pseudonocardiaceae bacterium]
MGSPIGAERLDVPLGFDVPDEWRPVDPATAGAPGAVVVLIREGVPASAGFTPNITMGLARRTDDASAADIADEAIGRLAATGVEVAVLERDVLDEQDAPCVTQLIECKQADRTVVQSQVHLLIPLGDAPQDRLAVEMVCSCTPPQLPAVTGDFQQFVASFHIRDDEQGKPDATAD